MKDELGNHSLLSLCACAILAGTYNREGYVDGTQINGALSTAKRVIEEARFRTVAPRIGPKPKFVDTVGGEVVAPSSVNDQGFKIPIEVRHDIR